MNFLIHALNTLYKFKVINLLSLYAPILGNLMISLLSTNNNKIVPNAWSISQESIYATVYSIIIGQINKKEGHSYFTFIYAIIYTILSFLTFARILNIAISVWLCFTLYDMLPHIELLQVITNKVVLAHISFISTFIIIRFINKSNCKDSNPVLYKVIIIIACVILILSLLVLATFYLDLLTKVISSLYRVIMQAPESKSNNAGGSSNSQQNNNNNPNPNNEQGSSKPYNNSSRRRSRRSSSSDIEEGNNRDSSSETVSPKSKLEADYRKAGTKLTSLVSEAKKVLKKKSEESAKPEPNNGKLHAYDITLRAAIVNIATYSAKRSASATVLDQFFGSYKDPITYEDVLDTLKKETNWQG